MQSALDCEKRAGGYNYIGRVEVCDDNFNVVRELAGHVLFVAVWPMRIVDIHCLMVPTWLQNSSYVGQCMNIQQTTSPYTKIALDVMQSNPLLTAILHRMKSGGWP